MAVAVTDPDAYYRVYKALHLVTHDAIPCVDNCLRVWHATQQQTLSPCTRHCPDGKKPKLPASCSNCVAWGKAIEAAMYQPPTPTPPVGPQPQQPGPPQHARPQPQQQPGPSQSSGLQPHQPGPQQPTRPQINWSNVNQSKLCNSHIEVAKAFVLRLPCKQATSGSQQYTSIADFDSASVLKIMAKFAEFHHGDQNSYDIIDKVAELRIVLSHMALKKDMHLEDQKVNEYFQDIEVLVTCLETLHPQHFTSAQDVRTRLGQIKMEPVTAKMKEEIQLLELQYVKNIVSRFSKISLAILVAILVAVLAVGVPLLFHTMLPPSDNSTRETPAEAFDVGRLKQTLIDIYREETGHIINLPWNENFHGRREMEDIFVPLQLEIGDSPGEGKRVLTNYTDLVKLTDKSGRYATRILLKGVAGTGKSTLLSKLANDWSKQESGSLLNKFELVFLLRMNTLPKNYSLIDAVHDQILEFKPLGLKEYIQQNQKKVLILFDGWDESTLDLNDVQPRKSGDGKKELKLEFIIRNDVLRKSCVIVSSRPHKLLHHQAQSKFYSLVNVEGFSFASTYHYVRVFFYGNDTKVESFFKVYFSRNPGSISNTPGILVMLCTLWEDTQEFPETVSLLYADFIETIWERFIQKEKVKNDNKFTKNTFDELQYHLGKVALEGLMPASNIKDNFLEFPADKFGGISELGLVVGVLTKQRWQFKLKEKTSISFLHKSVQEFFAGRYLASLFEKYPEQFHSVLNQIENWDLVVDKMELLKFACGHNKLAAVAIMEHVISIILDILKWKTEGYPCSIGKREEILIGKNTKNTICISELLDMLKESEIYQNDKLLSAFKMLLTAGDFLRVRGDDTLFLFHYFVRSEFGKALNRIKSVEFLRIFKDSLDKHKDSQDKHKDSLDKVSDALHLMPEVESVEIQFNRLIDGLYVLRVDSITRFAEKLGRLSKLSRLVVIGISNLNAQFDDVGIILRHLSQSPNRIMKYIHFQETHIGDAISYMGAIITPHLEHLDLQNNALEERHIEILSAYFSNAPNLKYLDLRGNTVGSAHRSLGYHLQHCFQLSTVLINMN